MSMKNSNNTIGNQTRDLPTCSAVTQPTAPPSASRVWVGKVIRGIKSSGLLRSVATLVIPDGLSNRLVSATMLLIVNNQKTSVFNFSAVETSYIPNSLMCIEWTMAADYSSLRSLFTVLSEFPVFSWNNDTVMACFYILWQTRDC
jgi:hypothetical protein